MEKKEFERLYFSMTNKKLAELLNISGKTLNTYARKLGLRKRKGYSQGNNPKIDFTQN